MRSRECGGRRMVLGATLLLAASAARATEVSLRAGDVPGSHEVNGRFEVAADPRLAWDVLTDYEGIPRFVSSVRRSRVLQRDERGALVAQEGAGRLLFVSRQVKLLLAVREDYPSAIAFADRGGAQFRRYEGAWRIQASSTGCVVSYSLRAQPDPALAPDFAAAIVLKRSAKRLLDEVRAEMLRRARDSIKG